MEAKELRIGNYLQDKLTGCLLSVCNLSEQNIITTVVDRSKFPLPDGWSLEPMPLNEEWLRKFGFEPCSCGGFSINKNKLFHLNKNISFDSWGVVKTVHQLQNLHHALTGKELECSI